MDLSLGTLRIIREVAQRQSFTAAARELGYSQSAVSRQIAHAEKVLKKQLFDRQTGGVRPTAAGLVLVRQSSIALEAMDAAEREMSGAPLPTAEVRLGYLPVAGPLLLPALLARISRAQAAIEVSTRQATTPSLVRALRAGALDLAVLTSRPPHRALDQETPPLRSTPLTDLSLALAVPLHGRFGGRASVNPEEIRDEAWIVDRSPSGETVLGVWPGLPGRPRILHQGADWLSKLALVRAGAGITVVPEKLPAEVLDGIHITHLVGVPPEVRRVSLAYRPGRTGPAVRTVGEALKAVVAESFR
ncbi:LysR family transcriptional regulator [Kineosporia sp. NBRC 101731]|uniref:LysR family transcriptional regulator n=1 Tax=Kineosporia sp. NBRC 101731 TaxID=3032199 RepID=UPI0024A29888|nr:LysR family transcriptional regulator [Kineosporia sp. NBRC 101731]GLY29267.1 LysR family transcriptional regulator [Kineosporia sp. NBRC 101731]